LVENTSVQEEIPISRSRKKWVNRKKLVFNIEVLLGFK